MLSKTIFSLVFVLFSFKSLANIDDNSYAESLKAILEVSSFEQFQEHLHRTLDNPRAELVTTLNHKIVQIIDGKDPIGDSRLKRLKLIEELVNAYDKVGSQENTEIISELNRWTTLVLKDEDTDKALLALSLKLGERPALLLPSLNSTNQKSDDDNNETHPLIAAAKKQNTQKRDAETAIFRAKNLLEKMQQRVIGQDEVLKGLQALYVKDLIRKFKRVKPEIFYLMGLPGNGKDTIAEAYTDAVWGIDGAYHEHMFRMNIRNKAEAWSYFGSGKGYIGSAELPDFLKFLVQHSDGKYILKKVKDPAGTGERTIVEKNPNWKEQTETLSLTLGGPSRAVVFVNEVHNMPKGVKDNILKQAIEKGIFPITNPGDTENSASTIELPVTFIFASNEGIELLEPRESNGARLGPPLSYEDLISNHDRYKEDKPALKKSILRTNGNRNDPVSPESPGTSEEFLSRIPDGRVYLLKPLSKDEIKEIVHILETKLTTELRQAKGSLGTYDVKISEDVVDFVINQNYIASENARPVESRLETLILEPFYNSIVGEDIKATGLDVTVDIGISNNDDKTKSLTFEVSHDDSSQDYAFTKLIESTVKDRPKDALTDAEIDAILGLREQILDNVFGIEHIVDKLVESALNAESEARNTNSEGSADVLAFLGKTSTGKTETAKQYVKARYGEKELPVTIDFNGIQTLAALNAKILGTFDSRNNPIPSDFMKAFDRAQDGKIAFIFDEAANAPKELLKALYEILREPIATGFTDGEPRSMKNVTIILTGNAGEEIYEGIPPSLPTDIQEKAMHEVFRLFINDEAMQKRVLNKTFPEALLARIGRNIFHFGPLTDKSKRQLSQLKLMQGIKRLKSKPSERGWNILFESEEDLLRLLHMIEIEGYNYGYQGASIDKFVKEGLIDAIKTKLLSEKFNNGSNVVLSVADKSTTVLVRDIKTTYRSITLTSESGRQVNIDVPLEKRTLSLPEAETNKVLTAYHEAGHEIVSHYFFSDRIDPVYLTILPGVSMIGGELVHYAGLRSGTYNQQLRTNKETLLMHAAILAGGYTAEKIITLGKRHDAGKSNDLKRASTLIREGILRLGLSNEWERAAVPGDMKTSDYIDQNLSDGEKERLNVLTKRWLKRAEKMAFEAIMSNLDGPFVEMSKRLAAKGQLNKNEILEIYEQFPSFNRYQEESVWSAPVKVIEDLDEVLQRGFDSNKDEFLERFKSNNFDEDTTPEAAFNFLSKRSVSFLNRLVGKHTRWQDLSAQEQKIAHVIISGFMIDERRDAKLSSSMWLPPSIADIDDVIKIEREKVTAEVTQTSKFSINNQTQMMTPDSTEEEALTSSVPLTCKGLL